MNLDPEDTITISKEEYKRLQSHADMLGVIGAYVEDFCEDEEDTVLQAVIRLLAKYHESMADYYFHRHQEHNK
jgi:hypothetical protein